MSWKARYIARHRLQHYPNSGLIIGTSAGFEALSAALHRTPRFPCCSYEGEAGGFAIDPCMSCRPPRRFDAPVSCVVDDQACLQVTLASAHRPAFAIDKRSSLFLNLHDLTEADLAVRGGRLAFRHTGEVPCVLHANGYKGILHRLAPRLASVSWFAQRKAADHEVIHDLRSEWKQPFALHQLDANGVETGKLVRWPRLLASEERRRDDRRNALPRALLRAPEARSPDPGTRFGHKLAIGHEQPAGRRLRP
uniref:Uncharacterized protein n=1 Tax=Haptolina brevifila TaxID=156173 RepID=A0A7S2IQF3_9EUKA|mmetsp:Transcript_69040/g.136846  ORF Transcript_69040/g.136846 Transcript_69040/m.136846 type:complete len:251 (+) Transcript_69040:585-1337(+)